MRLLVTGASGFIGAAVVRRALAQGHEVIAAVRPGADLWRLPPIHAPNALVDYQLGAKRCPHPLDVDAVIHCAWANKREERDDADAQYRSFYGTLKLFDACVAAGVKRFVGVGSQAEGQHTPYGRAKSAARDLVMLRTDIERVWARLYSVYGPGERRGDSLLVRLIAAGLAWQAGDPTAQPFSTHSSCEHRWHYLYEDDAADQLLVLATNPPKLGEVDLPGWPAAPLGDLLDFVRRKHFPTMPSIAFGTRHDADLAAPPRFAPPAVSFAEGVKRLVEAMRRDAR